jgi:hypothetical protein
MLEPDIPDDGLPMTGHVVLFPVIPIVAAGAGLSPGAASSVVPRGVLAGGTGEPGVMPSGEVMPSSEGTGAPVPIWKKAAPQPKSTVAIAAIKVRIIAGCSLLRSTWGYLFSVAAICAILHQL